jgi:hypothetical protein
MTRSFQLRSGDLPDPHCQICELMAGPSRIKLGLSILCLKRKCKKMLRVLTVLVLFIGFGLPISSVLAGPADPARPFASAIQAMQASRWDRAAQLAARPALSRLI